MHVDFTKYFTTSDELVEFLLKDVEEQDLLLANIMVGDKESHIELSCNIPSDKYITVQR